MMRNKIVLITGATGGIGKQTALALARMGAQLIITGRNSANGNQAVEEIRQVSGNPNIELLLADVSKQADIKALAANFKAKYDHLDVLINNAGLAASDRQLTEDGIESNFAANVIAPFLLTDLLLDRLKASGSGRVINLMGGDVPANFETNNLQAERSFDGLRSYSQSKLAMMVMMVEFAQRTQGTKVTINTCYPGQASTNMTRSVTPEMLPFFMRWMFPLFRLMTRPDNGRSAAKASQSSVYLASSSAIEGITGKYFSSKCKETAMPKVVLDSAVRQNLWAVVHQLTNPLL
jgi:NAD(P)-dependent dehydrogenase (short-subunit alcohol dehydrogenase family)